MSPLAAAIWPAQVSPGQVSPAAGWQCLCPALPWVCPSAWVFQTPQHCCLFRIRRIWWGYNEFIQLGNAGFHCIHDLCARPSSLDLVPAGFPEAVWGVGKLLAALWHTQSCSKHPGSAQGVPEGFKFGLSGKISSWEGLSSTGTAERFTFLQGFNCSVRVTLGDTLSGDLGGAGDGWI